MTSFEYKYQLIYYIYLKPSRTVVLVKYSDFSSKVQPKSSCFFNVQGISGPIPAYFATKLQNSQPRNNIFK